MTSLATTRDGFTLSPRWRTPAAAALFVGLALLTASGTVALGEKLFIFVLGLLSLGLLYRMPIWFVGVVVAIRPLVDVLWYLKAEVGGVALNLQRLWGLGIPLFLAFALLLHVLRGKEQRHRTLPRAILWSLAAFYLLFWFGATRHRGLTAAMQFFLKAHANTLLFFVGYVFCRRFTFADTFLKAFLACAALPVLIAVGQGVDLIPKTIIEGGATNTTANFMREIDPEGTRVAGLYYDPGSLVVVLQTCLCAALFLLGSEQNRRWKVFAWIMLAALLFSMKNSYLRQGWVSVLVVFGTWLILRKHYLQLAAAASLLPLAIVSQLEYLQKVFTGVYEIFFETNVQRMGYLWSGRIGAWMDFVDWFGAVDWDERLFGGGFGLVISGYRSMTSPHNQWIHLVMISGVLGLAAFLLIMLASLGILLRTIHRGQTRHPAEVAVQATFVLFLVFNFMCIGSQPLQHANLAAPLFLLLGWIAYHQPELQALQRRGVEGGNEE